MSHWLTLHSLTPPCSIVSLSLSVSNCPVSIEIPDSEVLCTFLASVRQQHCSSVGGPRPTSESQGQGHGHQLITVTTVTSVIVTLSLGHIPSHPKLRSNSQSESMTPYTIDQIKRSLACRSYSKDSVAFSCHHCLHYHCGNLCICLGSISWSSHFVQATQLTLNGRMGGDILD